MGDQIILYSHKDKMLSHHAFSNEGYAFESWNTKKDGAGDRYTDGQDVSSLVVSSTSTLMLYAQWTEDYETCKVTFVITEGYTKEVKAIKGEPVKPLDGPKLAGVDFVGWHPEGSDVDFDFSTPITEDITLYAHYEPEMPDTPQTKKIVAVMSKDKNIVTTAYDGNIIGKGMAKVGIYQLMTIRGMQVYVEIDSFEVKVWSSKPYFVADISDRVGKSASAPGSYAVMAEIVLDNVTKRLSNYTTFNVE